jgi:hypothetical protein
MTPTDAPILRDRLTELADALASKPPADAGLKAWFFALKEFPLDQIVGALDMWLRTRQKMPAPADIRQITAQRIAEQEARAQRELLPALSPPSTRGRPDSLEYLAFLQWWAAFKRRPPYCSHPDSIGPLVRIGSILEAPQFDFEALEERRAIQAL